MTILAADLAVYTKPTMTVQVVSGLKARIKVTVTAPPPGALMTIERVWGDQSAPVAGAIDLPAGSTIIDDAEMPLGRPVLYRLIGWGAPVTYGPVVAESDMPILSEPGRTGGWAPVAVTDWGEQTNPDRAEALRIEGSSHVVVVRDIEVDPSLPLVVETDTLADEQAVQAIGRTGMPLLLRWPADYGEEDAWLQSVGGRRRYRLSMLSPIVRHTWSTMQTVLPDLTRRAASDTLGDLAQYVLPGTTLGVIASRWATLGAIAATDLKTEG